ASASVPAAVADGTAASAKALALAEGFLKGTPAVSLRFAAACVLIAGVMVAGAGLADQPAAPPEPAAPPPKATEKAQPAPEPAAAAEDPLPAGALLRAGATRFRQGSVVTGISFSRDGKLLASAGWDAKVRLWETATGKELVTIAHPARVTAVALAPDGKTVASGSGD